MLREGPSDISGLLVAWSKGDGNALRDLVSLVYPDIRGIARYHLRRRSPRGIMESGTLAHEAFLRLVNARGIRCDNRAHFLALCSQMIRRTLVDHARKLGSAKRGGVLRVPLDEGLLGGKARGVDVEALDEALTALAHFDARKARVIELRFFGGLSVDETAEVLAVSEQTVERDWRMAKTWLFRELGQRAEGSG